MPRKVLLVMSLALLLGALGTCSPRGSEMVNEADLRTALSRKLRMDKDSMRLEVGPPVPGLLVFYAYDPKNANSAVTGVYDGELHFQFEESSALVLRALGYGEQEVDPMVVAAAVGKLEGAPGTPFLTDFAIEQSGIPAVMSLPRIVEVDGQKVVEYWNMTPRRPFWRSRVLRKADGTFEVRQELPGGR